MRLFDQKNETPPISMITNGNSPNTHINRMLLTTGELIGIGVGSSIGVIMIIMLMGYVYYRKYQKDDSDKTDEELEAEYEAEMERLRIQNEREWEEKRFSKMRYIGNSEFISWKLIRKVKIIEGYSDEVFGPKGTKMTRKEYLELERKKELEKQRLEEEAEADSGGELNHGSRRKNDIQLENDSIDNMIKSKDSVKNTDDEEKGAKLPPLNPKRSARELEPKPTDTKLDIFVVNAQRKTKTPMRPDYNRIDSLSESSRLYKSGSKRTTLNNENTREKTILKQSRQDAVHSKENLEDSVKRATRLRRLSTQSLENRKYLRQRATVSVPLSNIKVEEKI